MSTTPVESYAYSYRLEGKELPYDAYTYRTKFSPEDTSRALCILFKARAYAVDLSDVQCDSSCRPKISLVVELVGNRFLRKMVRILTATAVKESFWTPSGSENEFPSNKLLDIALSKDRLRTSAPLPGEGLCMCGVGYELPSVKKKAGSSIQPASNCRSTLSDADSINSVSKRAQRRERRKRGHTGEVIEEL